MNVKRALAIGALALYSLAPSNTANAASMQYQDWTPPCPNCKVVDTTKAAPKRTAPKVKYSLPTGRLEIYNDQGQLVRSQEIRSGRTTEDKLYCTEQAAVRLPSGKLDRIEYGVTGVADANAAPDNRIFTPDELRAAGGSVTAKYNVKGYKANAQVAEYNAKVKLTLEECVAPAAQQIPTTVIENTTVNNKVDVTISSTPAAQEQKEQKPKTPVGTEQQPYGKSYTEVMALFGKGMQNFEMTNAAGVREAPVSHNLNVAQLILNYRSENVKVGARFKKTVGSDGLPTGYLTTPFSNTLGATSAGITFDPRVWHKGKFGIVPGFEAGFTTYHTAVGGWDQTSKESTQMYTGRLHTMWGGFSDRFYFKAGPEANLYPRIGKRAVTNAPPNADQSTEMGLGASFELRAIPKLPKDRLVFDVAGGYYWNGWLQGGTPKFDQGRNWYGKFGVGYDLLVTKSGGGRAGFYGQFHHAGNKSTFVTIPSATNVGNVVTGGFKATWGK